MPCLNQVYVDNVKLWFQKSVATGVEAISANSADDAVTVYNLQGNCLLRNADKSALSTLPAGLYIVNGRKSLLK